MAQKDAQPTDALRVMIVGAGIGGLMLAALLEIASIEYSVFERAPDVKPLGSALSLGANVFLAFEQLGILEEFYSKAKPFAQTRAYGEGHDKVRIRDYSPANEIAGYLPHIIARPDLYEILLKRIPAHKVHYSKKVLSIQHKDSEVIITCSDKTSYSADILVGADGAYSAVRQGLYKHIHAQGNLPVQDQEIQLPFKSICLVGQTTPQPLEKFPQLTETFSRFDIVVGDSKPYTWVTFSTRQQTICWMVILHLDKESSREHDSFRNSEWGPESAQSMCKEVEDFILPSYSDIDNDRGSKGLKIKDLIDQTPKDRISKVMLEEKLFQTWFAERTVLLGDACHKMHPSAGLGAVSAIHDAIVLANVLHDLPSKNPDDITRAFLAYKDERYPLAKVSWDTSHKMSQVLGKTWINAMIRFGINHMPDWIWTKALSRMYGYRPQVGFLPLVKDRGSVKPAPQPSLVSRNANHGTPQAV
ncbi:hypothetical protein BGZ92_005855 [Podila epicladia]|nr:hypothetical protein BGZ92_005855 [Podila epicladia]